MVDKTDPNTWTKSYVSSNKTYCLQFLRELNFRIIDSIHEKEYAIAMACMDRLLNGLIIMHNAKCDDYRSSLSMYSICAAMIMAFGVPHIYKGVECREDVRRKMVIGNLEDARDFSTTELTKEYTTAIIADLKSGMPLTQLQQKYASDFPQATLDVLHDMGNQL